MPGLNGEVWSANLDGSGAALLVGNQATPVAIAAGVAGFAWLNAGDQTLKLVPSGATAAIVTVLGSAPLAIAADPMWINWTQTDGQVLRELWDGSGMKIVGAAQMSPDSIAPPPSGAPGPYWTETGAGNVRYFGTTGTMLLDKAEQSPRGITTDDASAYWADTTAGSVLTAPMGGGTVATVIGQQSAPIAVLVDAVSVFWMNSAQGKGTAILRLAR
jgi:hypothetical protein